MIAVGLAKRACRGSPVEDVVVLGEVVMDGVVIVAGVLGDAVSAGQSRSYPDST